MNYIATLAKAVGSFPQRRSCSDPNYCYGDCDSVSVRFLDHAKKHGLQGVLLAVDNPTREPTEGWDRWGGDWRVNKKPLRHYMVYFPYFETGVDWTARQFWHQCEVPLVLTRDQIRQLWDKQPYDFWDCRQFDKDK